MELRGKAILKSNKQIVALERSTIIIAQKIVLLFWSWWILINNLYDIFSFTYDIMTINYSHVIKYSNVWLLKMNLCISK